MIEDRLADGQRRSILREPRRLTPSALTGKRCKTGDGIQQATMLHCNNHHSLPVPGQAERAIASAPALLTRLRGLPPHPARRCDHKYRTDTFVFRQWHGESCRVLAALSMTPAPERPGGSGMRFSITALGWCCRRASSASLPTRGEANGGSCNQTRIHDFGYSCCKASEASGRTLPGSCVRT